MGAKGNQFWKARSTHGRKPIFDSPEGLFDAACEYFQWVEDNPLGKAVVYQGEVKEGVEPLMRAMTIEGLCIFLDIGRSTFNDYETKDDFSEVTEAIKNIIRTQKLEGASAGLLNPSIIARDLGLKDANTSEISGPGGGPVETTTSINFIPVTREK
jgi:hypothetical protein